MRYAIVGVNTFHSFDLDHTSLRVEHLSVVCSGTVDRYTYKKFRALGFLLKEIFVRYEKWNAPFVLKCV